MRLIQLAWTLLIAAGSVPTLAIVKQSVLHGYWPGLLGTATHLVALGLAYTGLSLRQWHGDPGRDLLPIRAARAQRFTVLRRAIMLEASILVAWAPLRTLGTGAALQWGWPALLSVAMLLICVALERIVRAEWREHQRLVSMTPPHD